MRAYRLQSTLTAVHSSSLFDGNYTSDLILLADWCKQLLSLNEKKTISATILIKATIAIQILWSSSHTITRYKRNKANLKKNRFKTILVVRNIQLLLSWLHFGKKIGYYQIVLDKYDRKDEYSISLVIYRMHRQTRSNESFTTFCSLVEFMSEPQLFVSITLVIIVDY